MSTYTPRRVLVYTEELEKATSDAMRNREQTRKMLTCTYSVRREDVRTPGTPRPLLLLRLDTYTFRFDTNDHTALARVQPTPV